MTIWDKGQIATMFDAGSSLSEIAEATNYTITRLRWMIEGIRNTNAWLDLKDVYKENPNGRTIESTHSGSSGSRRSGRINGTSDGTQKEKKANTSKHSSSGWCADPQLDIRINSGSLSQRKSIRRTSSGGHAYKRDQVSDQSRRTGTIVDSLRQHKDYRGE